MKKSHHFTVLSDVKCRVPKCKKFLKLRLVQTKQPNNINKCYEHRTRNANVKNANV